MERLWYWLAAKDPALNLDQRLSRWVNVATAIGFAVSLGGGAVGWLYSYPWIGVLVGLVIWVAVLNLFMTLGRRSQLSTSPEPAGQEQEQLKAELRKSEQEREKLEKQLEEARSNPDRVGKPSLRQEDALAVISRLTAERDELREKLESCKADTGLRGTIARSSIKEARALEEENEQLKAERDALKEEVAQTLARQKTQPDDEDLRQQCLTLSEELFQFLDKRGKQDPQRNAWLANASDAEINEYSQATILYDQETMRLYKRQLGGKVVALFEKLKQRGWWKPENLEPKERQRFEDPVHSSAIERIAQRLNAIGHR